MRSLYPSRYIGVSINRPPAEVYAFAIANLPRWASGIGGSMKKAEDGWLVDSPAGQIKIEFAPDNEFGVLDHEATLPTGEVVYNPMRVYPNNRGSEVVFTLYRLPDVSDEDLERDANMIRTDLETLKDVLEAGK